MDLDTALKGMFAAEATLRTREGIMNPTTMSEGMMRLSQYTGSVEEHLAQLEKDLEIESSRILKEYMLDEKIPVTRAERLLKIAMGEKKGQVIYLTRLVASAWKQVGVVQSRINHLVREAQTQL